MIDSIASTLSTTLSITVFYGFLPDADDGSLDEAVAVIDFPMGVSQHDFGEDDPAITYYGIEARARAATQADARDLCQQVYDALLSMGFTAVVPPILFKQDDKGRIEAVAQVQAHEIRS